MVRNLRKRQRVSYYEPDEPDRDEYIFCSECADYVYEYCSIHGPLLVVPDNKVPAKSPYLALVPRSILTLPNVFLCIAKSMIPGAGLGVFATLTLPGGVRFGPYRGTKTDVATPYCWQIYDKAHKPLHLVDASDARRSNWMRFVNCARHATEQNLLAYQYQGQIYYRTLSIIPRGSELLVYYGGEFASLLGIDVRIYNKKDKYIQATTSEKPPKVDEVGIAVEKTCNTEENIKKKGHEVTNFKKNLKKQKEFIYCDNCNTRHTNKQLLAVHLKSCIERICKECNFKCYKQDIFEKHLTSHEKIKDLNEIRKKTTKIETKQTGEKPYKCDFCNYKCAQKGHLVQHIRRHTGEKPYKCDFCNYKCAQKGHLVTHVRTHTGEKPYKCDFCNFKCSDKRNLVTHIRTHTGEKPYKCDFCNYKCSVKSSLDTHVRTHTGEKPYKCDFCNYKCILKGHLVRHIRTHTGEKPYKCDFCNVKCAQKGQLVTHVRTHTGEKPYKCDFCNVKCAQKGQLVTHVRTHTGEKPYKCDFCNYKCILKGQLVTHVRTHTGEKPYKCDFCNVKCAQKGQLVTHVRTHTGEKPYKCDQCNYKCSDRSSLFRHIRTHTGEKP